MVDLASDDEVSGEPEQDTGLDALSILDLEVDGSRTPVRGLADEAGWYVLAASRSTRFPYALLRRGKARYSFGGRTRWSRVSLVDSAEKRLSILAEFRRRAGAAEFDRWFPEPGRLLHLGAPSEEEPAVADPYGDWLRSEFEVGAAGYAARIVGNPVEAGERRRTTEILRQSFPRPLRLLELGSGPGPETVDLLGDGHTVTSVDVSTTMLGSLQRRAEAAGVDGRLRTENVRLASISAVRGQPFDGAYSTFGALNCEPELDQFATGLASLLRPGAKFVAGVFNSLAAPELLGGVLTGRWGRATARLRRPVAAEHSRFGVDWYAYRVSTFFGPFRNAFDLERFESVGVVVPPPDAVDRWPALANWVIPLQRWDARVGRLPGLRAFGDQLVLHLRRRGAPP